MIRRYDSRSIAVSSHSAHACEQKHAHRGQACQAPTLRVADHAGGGIARARPSQFARHAPGGTLPLTLRTDLPHPADAAAAGAVPLRRRSTAPPLLDRPAGPPDSRSAFGRTYPCRIDAVAAFPRRRAAAPPRRRTAAAAPSPSRRAAPSPSRRAKSLSRRGAAARCTYRLAGSSRRQQQLRAVMPPRRRAAVPSFTTLPPPLLSLPALAATRPPQLGGSRRIGHRQ